MFFVDVGLCEKMGSCFTVFKSLQCYYVFIFSIFLVYNCFMMCNLSFLTRKISSHYFSKSMIDIKQFYITYRGILSTNMKGSLWNFWSVVKRFVQMNQKDDKTFRLFLTEKVIDCTTLGQTVHWIGTQFCVTEFNVNKHETKSRLRSISHVQYLNLFFSTLVGFF